ncbi:sensor histidine kinase [Rhodococcus gannanensis]|uniref:Oxygen sensor histidine kinase NreB n=1 Tax=Rhodococcus gannanensis TaxID=1960308 RepID=A0ABW4P192_9NOCA
MQGNAAFRGPMGLAIHATFYLLLAASTARYLTYHGVSGRWVVVAALVVTLATLYAVVVVQSRRGGPWQPWVWPVLTSWVVLVWLAPSFAWSAFPIFFLCTSVFPRRVAYPVVAGLAVFAGVEFASFSGRTEWPVLLAPLCTGALIVLAFGQVQRENAERERLLGELVDAKTRLAETEREAGMLSERERIAREIHDTVTQGLTSALLHLEAADELRDVEPEKARDEVEVATASLRDNLAETRNLVHYLGAPDLTTQSLDAALLAAARGYVPSAQLQVVGDPVSLPDGVRHTLLRITQSAVSNVRRHAHAQTVGVTLTYLPDAVALDVFDDGVGFEVADAHGFGLPAMRQRVEALGGTFGVESSPGEGTVVAAQIPTAKATQ